MGARRAVPEHVLAILMALSGALPGFYLAGGTSLAWRFGHRVSEDLDFFHPQGFATRDLLQDVASTGLAVDVEYEDGGTLRLFAGPRRVKVEVFRYAYPLVAPPDRWEGVAVAAAADVGLMKLSAIAGRGSRKDFVDLYWICHRATALDRLLAQVPVKFARHLPDPYHLARSLGYFEDAEADPPLKLLAGPPWAEIRRWFATRADELLGTLAAGGRPWA